MTDLSTKAGALQFAELQQREMAEDFRERGRFEVNGFAFIGFVFATHEITVPETMAAGLDGWRSGAKLPRVEPLLCRIPEAFRDIIPPENMTAFFGHALRAYATLGRAIGTLLMSEVWSVTTDTADGRDEYPERLQDYDGPDRREMLYMQLEHAAVGRRVWTADITREPTRLAPWRERTDFVHGEVSGRLVDLSDWRS